MPQKVEKVRIGKSETNPRPTKPPPDRPAAPPPKKVQ
jgi:hypothetical protein